MLLLHYRRAWNCMAGWRFRGQAISMHCLQDNEASTDHREDILSNYLLPKVWHLVEGGNHQEQYGPHVILHVCSLKELPGHTCTCTMVVGCTNTSKGYSKAEVHAHTWYSCIAHHVNPLKMLLWDTVENFKYRYLVDEVVMVCKERRCVRHRLFWEAEFA